MRKRGISDPKSGGGNQENSKDLLGQMNHFRRSVKAVCATNKATKKQKKIRKGKDVGPISF